MMSADEISSRAAEIVNSKSEKHPRELIGRLSHDELAAVMLDAAAIMRKRGSLDTADVLTTIRAVFLKLVQLDTHRCCGRCT
jgi:hypothetical protein